MYLCSHTLPAAVLDPDKLLQGIWVMQLTETIFGPSRSLSVLSRHGCQMVDGVCVCVLVCGIMVGQADLKALLVSCLLWVSDFPVSLHALCLFQHH